VSEFVTTEVVLRRSTIRKIALAPLLSPLLWAWPIAAWFTVRAPSETTTYEAALRRYYGPALGLLLLGCVPSLVRRVWDALRRPRRDEPESILPRRVLLALTVLVLTVAVGVRLWRIHEWPPEGIGFEEFQIAARGNMGPSIFQNLIASYSPPSEHAFTAYTISVAFALIGPGFLELRLPFILFGLLCVLIFYAICRRLVAWEVALFAVALFGVCWWQIASSRVADEIFLPIWVELAVLWFLIEFEDTGGEWAAFCLALFSGLLVYEYTSYHLAPLAVIAYLTARLLWFIVSIVWRTPAGQRGSRVRDALRTYGPGALVLVLVWVIIAQLQITTDLSRGMSSWAAGGVGGHANDADGLLVNLRNPSGLPAFLQRRLGVPFRLAYLPGNGGYCLHLGIGSLHAAFDRATAMTLGVSVLLVAATFWRRFHALALGWAALIVAGAALLPENLNPHRYYTGIPLFFLIIALGAEVLWRWLRPRIARAALLAIFAGIVAYAAVDNFQYLFWKMVPHRDLTLSWRWPRTEVVKWVRSHRRDDWICLIANDVREIDGPNPVQPEWHWLVDGWNVRVSEWGTECIPATDHGEGGMYYVFAQPAPAVDLDALLRSHYPTAVEQAPITLPERAWSARTFYVPPPAIDAAAAPRPAQGG
jgi:hypothetical protein